MKKTKKIQVTLEEARYDELLEIARKQGRKLASIVRESIEEYALAPATARRKRDALEELFALDPTPVPDRYEDWEREYGKRKTKTDEDD